MSVNVTQTGYGAIVDVTQTGQAAQVDVIVSRGLPGSDATYTLPTATASVLGGVKIGSGITITDGVISASSYTLPTATDTVLGGVKIGSGVTITDGVISVTPTGIGSPSGSGTSTGTNTGDNAVNSLYSGLVSNATHTGDATGATDLTLATVNSNVGSFGSGTQSPTFTVNAKGLITAASATTITPAGIGAAPARELVTASTLTAVAGGRYSISNAGLCTITDPATGTTGQSYTVIVGTGTAKWATGSTYSPSRFQLIRYCTATNTWTTLSPVISDAATLNGVTFNGTSFSYGTGAAAAHLTALGGGATGISIFQSATQAAAWQALATTRTLASDESITNTIASAAANSTGFSTFSIVAGEIYEFLFVLLPTTTSPSGNSGFEIRLISSVASAIPQVQSLSIGGNFATNAVMVGSNGNNVQYIVYTILNNPTSGAMIQSRMVFRALQTATLNVRWGQNTATSATTNLLAGSSIIQRRIA